MAGCCSPVDCLSDGVSGYPSAIISYRVVNWFVRLSVTRKLCIDYYEGCNVVRDDVRIPSRAEKTSLRS